MAEQEEHTSHSSLRRNVSFLGRCLGETIAAAEGEEFLELIESIRQNSRAAREGDKEAGQALLEILRNLDTAQLVPVVRAFSQFLNLANIADQYHAMSREMDPILSASQTLATTLAELKNSGIGAADITATVNALSIELVLTAHPTEITRRTLIHKHGEINRCLAQLELSGQTERELQQIHARVRELLAQIWYGYDFRRDRPSPVDEAKWGLAVVEDSLWKAVPEFLRRLDKALADNCGVSLPLEAAPVKFLSWMGGDRDGNPNVTARVTEEVLLLSRWQAADLYLKDLGGLVDELSMTRCDENLRELTGDAHEPYRAVLRPLREMLKRTLRALERELEALGDPTVVHEHHDILMHRQQLWEPLHCCYQSMLNSGMTTIANGALLDVLRRVQCFGVHLVRHDVRQDSARHTQALSELTTWLGIGNYEQWDEPTRLKFLIDELGNRRPLVSAQWQPSADTKEVFDTCRVVAAQSEDALGAYVISMARQPSDVLAVHLLLKETGCEYKLPVVPLFETLDDLARARESIETLLNIDWYRGHINGELMVMIGYSDSAKDAGVLAASWAQYTAQETLLATCASYEVELVLFHGRGGTIGRGGAPAHAALLSQAPGSLKNGLRVTEQGETIRTKLGLSSLAVKTLALYTSAILEANLTAPPAAKTEWREIMDELAEASCAGYREIVREQPDFVAYFRHATPEQELGSLPLGSRPARRAGSGGIETLRAIPWIFAWMQNRLMLPSWLGAGKALQQLVASGKTEQLLEMVQSWPFFATRLSMLEMVFAKADANLSAYYDQRLVPKELRFIGDELRGQMAADTQTLLQLTGKEGLLADQDWLRESIQLRNIYTDPLNVLQAELLHRQRSHAEPELEEAVMVTIAGIAAGMRNTG
ncbi:MAG: phosphoenolpyruvate carboxylase [Halieaceae bacterium]|jgi:phosphoenolpyruvate carboxylase